MSEQNNSWDNKQRLGGLWRRESKSGNKYLTGKITLDGQDYNLVIFAAKSKKTDKSPDFNVYLSEDTRGSNNSQPAQQPAPRQQARPQQQPYRQNNRQQNTQQTQAPAQEFI